MVHSGRSRALTMMNWVDIVSPQLRRVHQDWMGLRAAGLMPDIRDYNAFAGSALMTSFARTSALVVIPPDGSSPTFKHVGPSLGTLLPNVHAGSRLSDMLSPMTRHETGILFKRVCGTRQPETRRGKQTNNRDFELLLLPFGDGAFRVCLVYGVYDVSMVETRSHIQ